MEKPKKLSNCHPERAHHGRGLCKPCHNKSLKRQENLRLMYNISISDYEEMLSKQDGKCKICKTPPSKRRLHVDHDHLTGKIRGLLCHKCNVGLGCFSDNTELLIKAINYLQE